MRTRCGTPAKTVMIGCWFCGASADKVQVREMKPVCSTHRITGYTVLSPSGGTNYIRYVDDPRNKIRGLWYYKWKTLAPRRRRIKNAACGMPTSLWAEEPKVTA